MGGVFAHARLFRQNNSRTFIPRDGVPLVTREFHGDNCQGRRLPRPLLMPLITAAGLMIAGGCGGGKADGADAAGATPQASAESVVTVAGHENDHVDSPAVEAPPTSVTDDASVTLAQQSTETPASPAPQPPASQKPTVVTEATTPAPPPPPAATTPLPAAATASPFGVAPSASTSNNPRLWATDIAKSGVEWVRGFNRSPDLAAVDILNAAGYSVSGFFGYHPVNDIPKWRSYVNSTTRNYKGKVKYWEVWNEPPNFTPNTPPQEYGMMVSHAYTEAKAVDPSVQVGLAAQSVNLNYLDRALLNGAKNHFDFITVHPYEVAGLIDSGFEAQYMSIVPTIRKMLAARNPEKVNVPVIFTEVGQPVDTKLTAEMQADLLVKLYTLGIAQGALRTHWFEPLDGDSGPFGLLGANKVKRPSFVALSTMIEYVGKRPRYYGWLLLKGKHHGFVFAGPKGMVIVAWTRPRTTETLSFNQPMTIIDPRTGTSRQSSSIELTNAPRFIVSAGRVESWAATATANAKKPFPWDGDYTNAASVSITAPSTESGLHQPDPPVLRVIDGASVRDASKRAAQPFTVDPNFLSYTTRPIRITAVVRRNGTQSAGFNLKYEGVSGWRSVPGWNSVPSHTAWTTLSWVINDPQFVAKWGYNFAFDSDSTQNSGYSIKSVTLTKQ